MAYSIPVNPLQVIGIDLGTTISTVARIPNNGIPQLVKDPNGNEWIPSVVCYKSNGEVLVGELAERESKNNPKNVIYYAKRLLGRLYNDPYIQELKKSLPYEISEDNDPQYKGYILIHTDAGLKRPWEVCLEIIKHLIYIAQDQAADKKITHAVVSVPANYDTRQREETYKAACTAGLDVVHLISEPTAAIISYWYDNYSEKCIVANEKGKVLIFDFGGGTLDVSLAALDNNSIEIEAVDGDMLLGGIDFDNSLINLYLDKMNIRNDIMPYLKNNDKYGKKARNAMREIKKACKDAKEQISKTKSSVSIDPEIQILDDTELIVTYDEFKSMNKDKFDKFLDPVERVLKMAHVNKNETKEIILVGGSSYIPIVNEKLRGFFGKMPYRNGDPRNYVANGAAIEARRRFVENKDCCKELLNLKYHDVCPLSIGISLIGNSMSVIIPRNTKLPVKKTQTYQTTYNYIENTTIYIHETEKVITTNETLIGALNVALPSRQAGEVNISLTLSLDENCILRANAYVEGLNDPKYRCEKIIRQGSVFNDNYINSMVLNARINRYKDMQMVQSQLLSSRWIALHENVISFIQHNRIYVNKDKIEIFNTFNEILKIANREKNNKVLSENQLNRYIDDYKERFTLYNDNAPPNRQTNFLNNI